MPIIKWSDKDSEKNDELIRKLLPKRTLTESIILPILRKIMIIPLMKALKKELKIYRGMPKGNGKYDESTFDPRNNRHCFMGQGFYANSEGSLELWTDADLVKYRQAIGTFPHAKWGNATLLEIWAADHFEKYPEMVKAAHAYGFGKTSRMPTLHFHFLPFLVMEGASKWVPDPEVEKAQEEQQDNLINMLVEARIRNRKKKRDYDDED